MLCQQFAYRGATMDVTDWLRSLGLEGYEAAFRSNAVTAGGCWMRSRHCAVMAGPPRI
jgi:hypothetical protein